jgi:hypothetical protein
MTPSETDALVLKEIAEFRNPAEGWFERMGEVADEALAGASDRAFDTRLGEAAEKVAAGLAKVLNDAAAWTVRSGAIFSDFRNNGFEVDDLADIAELSVDDVRQTLRRLDFKYRLLGAAEGAATGLAGVVGIALDVPALLTLCLRAISETATYFGFDIDVPHERYYGLMVLTVVASATDDERAQSIAEITEVSRLLGGDSGQLPDMTPNEGLVDRLAQTLATRFSKGKLAQLVPVVGAAIGSSFNRAFLNEVCHTAELLYAERALIRKYGADVVAPLRSGRSNVAAGSQR